MPEPELNEEEPSEAESGVHVVNEVTMDDGEVNFGDSNEEVADDVLRGGVIRGAGHLTIKGSVLGDPRGSCEIDVSETVVLEQNIQYAKIRARHIVVLGDVANTDAESGLDMEVRSGLTESSGSLGYRTGEIQTLKRLRVEFQSAHQALDEIEVDWGWQLGNS